MKTLIVNGSPRKNGDTASLLQVVEARLKGEQRVVDTYRCDISPCVDCRYCWDHLGCAINDSMQKIYRYLEECDNLLLASPVYFSELTGRMLDFASRLQMYYCARKFQKQVLLTKPKKGAIILVGGGDGSIDRAHQTARMLLRQMNCREIFPLVCSHDTDHLPAIEDQTAVQGTVNIAAYFNA